MTTTSVGDPLLGHVLDGRYEITGRLARGGMATVYQALDTRLTRTVAVKVMHVGLGDDEEFARKFDREARAAARLSHPCVVSVFDQGRDGGRPYIVMEYVEGSTLRDLINREAPLDPQRALELIEPVLAALAAAHEAGLVHRDVKPENVLISRRGQLKVADFGLAKAVSSQTSTATQGLLIGTVSYLPPELVISGRADARSDVYSAGIVLFELLTGRKPHTGETPIQVAYAHVHRDVPPPSSLDTARPIPPYVDALVARATARDPDQRPHDAKVLLTQVRRVRAALRAGLADDPELTEDLSGVLGAASTARSGGPDDEVTQAVPTVGGYPTGLGAGSAAGPVFGAAQAFAGQGFAGGPNALTTPIASIRSAPPSGPGRAGTVRDAPPPPPVPRSQSTPNAPHVNTPSLNASHGGSGEFGSGAPTGFGAVSALPRSYTLSPERLAAQQDRRRRNRRRGWLVLLLVLLLTAASVLGGWYVAEGRFTTTPALEMLSQEDASGVAGKAGLQVSFEQVYSETVPKGLVASTTPEAGGKVLDGGEVTAFVSRGPERYAMPQLVGLTQSAATAALQASNLTVGKVSEAWSNTREAGLVTKAGYDRGQLLKPQTPVALTISKGPKPITITDWTGKSADKAEAALTKAGFTVTRTTEVSEEVDKGDVIAQDPATGTGKKGDAITLKVSSGPPLVAVPQVTRFGIKAAEQAMKEAGFKTRTRRAASYLGLGYVFSSDPSAGTQVPKGSTITLYVV